MYLIIKKFLIIFIFIIASISNQSKVLALNNYDFDDFGLISIMYHRFNENKYPSTNIQIDVFNEQLKIIEKKKKLNLFTLKILKKVYQKIKRKEKFCLQ